MATDTTVADELDRFLDTKDFESWRTVFTADLVAKVDLAVSTGGADPLTTPALAGVDQCRLRRRAGITRCGSLPRDLRKAGRHMADQDPALDEDHPAVGG